MGELRQDSRFGEVFCPSNFIHLLSLTLADDDDRPSVRMWRGHADQSWLLHTSIYRKLALRREVPTDSSVTHYEEYLLSKAKHKGFNYLDGRSLSDFELLGRLQHHGAATRLLDTTRSLLVALYFASCSYPSISGMLFGIHSDELGGGEGRTIDASYLEAIRGLPEYNHSLTWEPPIVSSRVAAQHSQFIYSGIKIKKPYGSIALSDKEGALLCIEISPSLKLESLRYLNSNFDINASTLFPDIDGFGQVYSAAKETYWNERW